MVGKKYHVTKEIAKLTPKRLSPTIACPEPPATPADTPLATDCPETPPVVPLASFVVLDLVTAQNRAQQKTLKLSCGLEQCKTDVNT